VRQKGLPQRVLPNRGAEQGPRRCGTGRTLLANIQLWIQYWEPISLLIPRQAATLLETSDCAEQSRQSLHSRNGL